jgi:WD40 repeat protein
MIALRNLTSGADHVLDEVGRSKFGEATISPDGSKVVFERDCKNARVWDDGTPLPCSFIVSIVGGEPEKICEFCTPRGFSSNGSVVLVQNYGNGKSPDTIAAVDLTSKAKKDFLRASKDSVYHAFFSWDDRWVAFKKMRNPEFDRPRIMLAPVRDGVAGREAEWIAITDGEHFDDKPQFSPDGKTVYFTSTRDGYLCIWAQKLDPERKRPVGEPFPFEHFHNSAQRGPGDRWETDLSVAKDKVLINLPQVRHDIWMTRVP